MPLRPVRLLALACAATIACSTAADTEEAPDSGTPTTEDCEAAANFIDVSKAAGPGPAYPAPSLRVTCTTDSVVVKTNDIPHYKFIQRTPNALLAQDETVTFPRHPKKASQPTLIVNSLGTIGITVGGTAIYGPNEGPMPADSAFGDPIANNITDLCFGHTAQRGDYHAHAMKEQCLNAASLVSEPWNNEPDEKTASPIIGYALDGFPIYGPRECVDATCTATFTLKSSYEQTGNPKTQAWQAYTFKAKTTADYLDRCNGHTGPDGDYHYHTTSTFPYIIGCFAGEKAQTNGDGGMPPPMDGGMMMPPRDGGMMMGPPPCTAQRPTMCCGDNVCDGPETRANCAADCR